MTAATFPVVLAEDMAMSTTSLIDFAGNTSPEVGFPAVAEGISLADCAGVASSVVGAGAGPLTVAEVTSSADMAGTASLAIAEVSSSADIDIVLRRSNTILRLMRLDLFGVGHVVWHPQASELSRLVFHAGRGTN